jgi:hypothetical protein
VPVVQVTLVNLFYFMVRTRSSTASKNMSNQDIIDMMQAMRAEMASAATAAAERSIAAENTATTQLENIRTELFTVANELRTTVSELETRINTISTLQESIPDAMQEPARHRDCPTAPPAVISDYRIDHVPNFDGTTGGLHPVEYLEKMEGHFNMYNVPTHFRLRLALTSLRGPAKCWGEVFAENWCTFEDFQGAFREEFWGAAQQRVIRNMLYQAKCPQSRSTDTAGYFLEMVAKARHLTPRLSEAEIIDTLIEHFRPNTAATLFAARLTTVIETHRLLRKFDEAYKRGVTPHISAPTPWRQPEKNDHPQSWRQNAGSHDNQTKYTPSNQKDNAADQARKGHVYRDASRRQVNAVEVSSGGYENNVAARANKEDTQHELDTARSSLMHQNASNNDTQQANMHIYNICTKPVDTVWEDGASEEIVMKSPEIHVVFQNSDKISDLALIDSGSDVCCISDHFFETLSAECPQIPTLSVPSINVLGAIGNASKRSSKQVLLTTTIGEWSGDVVFLVIPGLSRNVILGVDFMVNNKVHISFEKMTMSMETGNRKFLAPFHSTVLQNEQEHNISRLQVMEHELLAGAQDGAQVKKTNEPGPVTEDTGQRVYQAVYAHTRLERRDKKRTFSVF